MDKRIDEFIKQWGCGSGNLNEMMRCALVKLVEDCTAELRAALRAHIDSDPEHDDCPYCAQGDEIKRLRAENEDLKSELRDLRSELRGYGRL